MSRKRGLPVLIERFVFRVNPLRMPKLHIVQKNNIELTMCNFVLKSSTFKIAHFPKSIVKCRVFNDIILVRRANSVL